MTTKTVIKSAGLMALSVAACFGQAVTTQTTLATAISAFSTTQWCLASASGVVTPNLASGTLGSILFVDREAAQVEAAGSSATCFIVKRGQQGTSANYSHAITSQVWVGAPATGNGDPSRPFTGAFVATAPSGACNAAAQFTLPVIVTGVLGNGTPGGVFTCLASRWVALADGTFYVPPGQCSAVPTTLTVTNTYVPIPATTAPGLVDLNIVTNAAAGTATLVCNIYVPNNVVATRGAVITKVVAFIGSQTVAPTSLGTATFVKVIFPAPIAGSETASSVTTVAAGGTLTTVAPSNITSVTTAGAYLSVQTTLGTPADLSPDLTLYQYTLPLVQSAASAMTINTPGLLVYYSAPVNSLNAL
jgi:hypothetical protein